MDATVKFEENDTNVRITPGLKLNPCNLLNLVLEMVCHHTVSAKAQQAR